jgi:putative phage-type endonuclease
MEQGTPEWFAARLGKVTASRVSDVMAKLKTGGYGASRDDYMAQLICERLTGEVAESFTNSAMAWGTETEPMARAHYEMVNSVLVDQVGFIAHPDIQMAGASPDGIVGNGIIEIKCMNTHNHIDTLLSKKVPARYIKQIQFQLRCTGKEWCDFVSFDPRLKGLEMFTKRVERDEKLISEMDAEVVKFLSDLDEKLELLMKEKNGTA